MCFMIFGETGRVIPATVVIKAPLGRADSNEIASSRRSVSQGATQKKFAKKKARRFFFRRTMETAKQLLQTTESPNPNGW